MSTFNKMIVKRIERTKQNDSDVCSCSIAHAFVYNLVLDSKLSRKGITITNWCCFAIRIDNNNKKNKANAWSSKSHDFQATKDECTANPYDSWILVRLIHQNCISTNVNRTLNVSSKTPLLKQLRQSVSWSVTGKKLRNYIVGTAHISCWLYILPMTQEK